MHSKNCKNSEICHLHSLRKNKRKRSSCVYVKDFKAQIKVMTKFICIAIKEIRLAVVRVCSNMVSFSPPQNSVFSPT